MGYAVDRDAQVKRMCIECDKRPALAICYGKRASNRGSVQKRKNHPLCRECFRNMMNSVKASDLENQTSEQVFG